MKIEITSDNVSSWSKRQSMLFKASIGSVAAAFFLHANGEDGLFMFLLFLCAASLCVCIVIGGYIAQYESFRRKEIIVGAIRPYNYEPDSHVPASVVQVAGFYPKWKEIKGGNLVETIYRGVSLVFCDLLLSHIKGSGRTKKKHTDFEGTFMMIECHRWIEHAISIEERERPVRSVCQEGIQTENEAFNQRFEIKSDDLMEAMNVLTPRFMEKLMEADAYADARTCVKLLGNQIFVMLYNQKKDSLGLRALRRMKRISAHA